MYSNRRTLLLIQEEEMAWGLYKHSALALGLLRKSIDLAGEALAENQNRDR